jgi:LemA protein
MGAWTLAGGAVVVVLYVILVYNRLVAKRNRVRNAWSQIDVQLKRRHDLIPNLVEAVKGYLQHERSVVEDVSRARQQAVAAGSVSERAQAENALTLAVRSLFAVAEAYPALRASENVLALQEELSSTENRVGFARQAYNDAVMEYNTARERLPVALVAGALGFARAELFELPDGAERTPPQVRF